MTRHTMAEAGSFAERVKQQADIVRVIGEYVRLKKSGAEFHRPLPIPSGKNSFLRRSSREADLPLLRLRRRRRRFQIRDGDGEIAHFPKRSAPSPKNAASPFPSRASARPKSAAKISSAPRSSKCTARPPPSSRAHLTTAPKAKSPPPISKIAASTRSNEAFRPGLRAIVRRRASALPETKISRKTARRLPA